MKIKTLNLLFLFIANFAFSQAYYQDYNWEEKPSFISEAHSEFKKLAVLDKEHIDYINESNNFLEYTLNHKIYYLNSDESIESFNKVYIPINNQSELITSKARVINPDGKIQELSEDKIISATDEETGRKYRYFAFEGIEKGSYIEFIHVIKSGPRVYGRRINVEKDIDIERLEFDLVGPEQFDFKFKSFNNAPVVEISTADGRKTHSLHASNIDIVEKEDYSSPAAHIQYMIFALDRNNFNNIRDISSYTEVAQNLHDFFNQDLKRRTRKKLEKISKKLKLENKESVEEQIIAIENYIKKEYYLADSPQPELSELKSILDKQVANDRGMMLLYMKLLAQNNIESTPVITSNRERLPFDKSFEAHNYLQTFLIYIDKADAYIAPESTNARFPFIPVEYTDNYGLFLKKVKVGDFVSSAAEIDYIKEIPADKNIDKIRTEVHFDTGNPSLITADYEKHWFGSNAMVFQPFMDRIKLENREEIARNLIESVSDNIEINSWEILNDQPELFNIEPLIFKYEVETEDLVDVAGNNLIFKIGKLIGGQVEMYQEKVRRLPVEGQNNRIYDRKLVIHLPENYEIQNLEDIVIKREFKDEEKNEITMKFHSYYEIEDNILTVYADEFYKETVIPVENFKHYRNILNSAADFNNVSLILSPKE
ncbi:MAG: DUF3857 domain-containing protein [Bacteroidota bacterium]